MNGKIIFVLILCINFIALMIGSGCNVSGGCNGTFSNNVILDTFFKLPSDLYSTGYVNATDGLTTATGNLQTPQSGASAGGDSSISFLDGLKMALSIIALLTPLPTMLLIGSLGLPVWASLFISLIVVILFIVSLGEWMRGAKF